MIRNKLAAAAAAAVAAVTGVVTTAGATPAYALATCADGRVCFFQDFQYIGNGQYLPAGTMADQTNALLDHPTAVKTDAVLAGNQVNVDGKIANFKNSHYTNGQGLNDSISLIVNNSNNCLYIFGNSDFTWDKANHRDEAIEFGPHTSRALAGYTLGPDNDKFSSAFTVPTSSSYCREPVGQYEIVISG